MALWSGPNSKKLFLWDWQSGAEPRTLEAPSRGLHHLTFSPDGKSLAACGYLEPFAIEWDVATGRKKKRLELRDDVTAGGLAFHPDGKTLAIGDSGNRRGKNWSGGVLLVERDSGKIVRELATPGTSAGQVVFSPDGHWLAAVSGNGVRVWDVKRGEEVAAGAAGHQGMIGQIVATHGGLIATASDDHTVRLWDAATGKERRRLPHGHWVRAAAFSSDGRWLVSSSLDDRVHLWDVASGKEVYKLPGHGSNGGNRAVAFAPDGRRFLSWGDDLYLRVWDVQTGKALIENAVRPPGVKIAEEGEADNVRDRMVMLMMGPAAFTPDGKHLIATVQSSFHVIDVESGKVERSVENPGSHVQALTVAPDGRLFATSGWARSIQTKLPDGRTQIATPNHHPVCLIDVAAGKLVTTLELPTTDAGPVAFSPDGKLLALGFGRGGGEVRLLDAATRKAIAVLTDFGSGAHAMTFSADGKYLITGLRDGTSLVWDVARVRARKAGKEER